MENSKEREASEKIEEKPKKKQKEFSKLINTFFRNGLKSNLDLTALADTKAGILISINGFILTVSVTAIGFIVPNAIMSYAFISIILTSLGSIIFAVMAVKPRWKEKLVEKEFLEDYSSLLYYQDMADLSPKEYRKRVTRTLYKTKKSENELISHLHILGAEIKKKYFWLQQAYRFFSFGLIVSASLMIYALVYVEKNSFYNLTNGRVVYTKGRFYNSFEPSGATTLPDGKVLIVEDEANTKSFKLIDIGENGRVSEIGHLYLPKKVKKILKKDVADLEAITSDGNCLYAITSHALTRSNKRKADREKIMMFTYDDGTMENFHIYSDLKNNLSQSFTQLFKHNIVVKNRMNIEALSIDNGKLMIGFRSPIINSKAMIITVENPKEFFTKHTKPKFSKPIFLDLNGLGIRAMTYDEEKEVYWIIAGGSSKRNFRFELWKWDKKNAILSYVQDQPDIGYGEGITLVKRKSGNPALFIVKDNGKKPNKTADYVMIERDSL